MFSVCQSCTLILRNDNLLEQKLDDCTVKILQKHYCMWSKCLFFVSI